MSERNPINPYGYLMAKGEGTKGVNYRYTWRPDWRMPPGVKAGKVVMQMVVLLGLAAVPVYGPALWRGEEAGNQARQDHYMVMKQKNREQRMKFYQSDDMPYK